MTQRFLSPTARSLYAQLQASLSVEQKRALDRVLFMALCESLAKGLPKNHRSYALTLLKAQDPAFDTWLHDVSPHSQIAIEEALLRTLLSLRVE